MLFFFAEREIKWVGVNTFFSSKLDANIGQLITHSGVVEKMCLENYKYFFLYDLVLFNTVFHMEKK